MIRLFVALKIPDQVRKEIIRLRNSAFPGYHNYKWEPEDKIHLTLKFIGEIEEKLLEPVISELNFIEDYQKLNCRLTRFGFFFKNKEPKILWIGLSIQESVFDLVKQLNNRLEKFGVRPEKRDFKAHLTLMRIRKFVDMNFIKSFEDFNIPEIQFTAGEIVLFQSRLTAGGSDYTELNKFILK
ncbi:MAG TPA: RNA 2',3'-cyclic phosphodiesterase [Ignavibacteriaceae bacterium]|nr:RNA 2',3'-cyclic phosphodiesterase [Ignavibacteriaceae bacterium]